MTQLHPQRLMKIAQFELVRLFLTKRGLLAVAAFTICWLLVLRYPIGQAVSIVSSPEMAELAKQVFGAIGLSKLLQWPEAELAMYWLIALYSFPIFCLFLCSDQIVGDKHRGTLRFLTLRATRSEILFGRFFGQILILAALLVVTLFATLVVMAFRDVTLLSAGINRGAIILCYLLITVMPFVALMTLINTFASSARLAIVLAVLFFAVGNIIVSVLVWQLPVFSLLDYMFPGVQISDVAGQNSTVFNSVGIPVIQSAVLLFIAQRIFVRSSL